MCLISSPVPSSSGPRTSTTSRGPRCSVRPARNQVASDGDTTKDRSPSAGSIAQGTECRIAVGTMTTGRPLSSRTAGPSSAHAASVLPGSNP